MAAQAAAMRRRGRPIRSTRRAGGPAEEQGADAHQRRDEPDPRRRPPRRRGEPGSQEGAEAALDVAGEDVDERKVGSGEHALRPVCHDPAEQGHRSPRLSREDRSPETFNKLNRSAAHGCKWTQVTRGPARPRHGEWLGSGEVHTSLGGLPESDVLTVFLKRRQTLKRLALTLTAGAALLGAASTAQAYEWGGGYGYRATATLAPSSVKATATATAVLGSTGTTDDRPGVRVIERRGPGFRHHRDDWDD